jgi:queuine tRNA-ribosyltransferase
VSRPFSFTLEAQAKSSAARATRIQSAHGELVTPLFMPVGTHATVRGQWHQDLEDAGFRCLLANTYHLMLRPGEELVAKMGGLQKFMAWPGAVLTDSGGFQIFSLPGDREIREEGAVFRSYLDGKEILLSPERSIAIQRALNSDIMMALDQCIPATADVSTAIEAMDRTHRWAERSLAARGDSTQALFGIVQGACHPELRRASVKALRSLPFDGLAIGGLAVGETRELREEMTGLATTSLPANLPRYLMGVGTPLDLLEAVHRGVDMFDCILPTALARKGVAFTSRGRIDLRRGVHRLAERPLDPSCICPVCSRYSRAYLHHLIKVEESFGWQALARHNLHFYAWLTRTMRERIFSNTFATFYREWRERLGAADLDHPITPPKHSRRRRPALTLGNYTVHRSASGHYSLRHLPSGEIMHSVNDPSEEAARLYLSQSRLRERLAGRGEKIVVWDVGLGAAINSMAVIRATEDASTARRLELWSFERDLDALRLVLRHPHLFPHSRHPGPAAVLESGEWRTDKVSWRLLEGDFLDRMRDAPLPTLVYYDPFSFKTDGALWTEETFTRLFASLEPGAVELFTYSNSTAVRAALLVAGFLVARGIGTGPKSETTIALTPRASDRAHPLLGPEWLARWERSHVRQPAIEQALRRHAQFSTTLLG